MKIKFRLGDIEVERGIEVRIKDTKEVGIVVERYFFGKFCVLFDNGCQAWFYEDDNRVEIINK